MAYHHQRVNRAQLRISIGVASGWPTHVMIGIVFFFWENAIVLENHYKTTG